MKFTEAIALIVYHYGESHLDFLYKKEGIKGVFKEANLVKEMFGG